MTYDQVIEIEKYLDDLIHKENESGCNAVRWTQTIRWIENVRLIIFDLKPKENDRNNTGIN